MVIFFMVIFVMSKCNINCLDKFKCRLLNYFLVRCLLFIFRKRLNNVVIFVGDNDMFKNDFRFSKCFF